MGGTTLDSSSWTRWRGRVLKSGIFDGEGLEGELWARAASQGNEDEDPGCSKLLRRSSKTQFLSNYPAHERRPRRDGRCTAWRRMTHMWPRRWTALFLVFVGGAFASVLYFCYFFVACVAEYVFASFVFIIALPLFLLLVSRYYLILLLLVIFR